MQSKRRESLLAWPIAMELRSRLQLVFCVLLILVGLSEQKAWGQASVTVSVDPRAAFLHTNSDSSVPATIVDLATEGFAPGDLLEITYDFPPPGYSISGDCAPERTLPEQIRLLGVFSGSDTLLPKADLARVQDAIDTVPDFTSSPTFFGTQPTDIPEDFQVSPPSSFIIAVPTGATHLFLGMHDSFYQDNCVPGNSASFPPFGAVIVTINPAPVVQPPFSVDPRAAYLHTNNDSPALPTIVDLDAEGFAPGDLLEITYDFPAPGFSHNGCNSGFRTPEQVGLLGVFSGSATLLPKELLARVQDAIDTVPDFTSSPTFFGGQPTDIPEDFQVSPSSSFIIAVPTGATHLFLGMHDSLYFDNCVPGNSASFPPVGAVIVTINPAPVCVQPPFGLVSWWPGDGDAADIVGSNNGTVHGGAFAMGFVASGTGQAFSFDGVSDFVSIPDAANLEPQNLTIDAWVKAETVGSFPDFLGPVIISKDVPGVGASYALFGPGNTGRYTAIVDTDSSTRAQVSSMNAFAFLKFHHVAMTWDGSALKLYVNGLLALIAKSSKHENAKQPHWAQARSSCWGTRSPPL